MSKITHVAIYTCARCAQEIVPPEDQTNLFTLPYGSMPNGDKVCYPCCGQIDREDMISDGRATLYLCSKPNPNYTGLGTMGNQHTRVYSVTNWPNSLSFHVFGVSKGHHNIARNRYDVWFNGPDGCIWHGTQYGDMTQLCHCKRTRRLWRMPQSLVATYGLK